MLCEKDSQDVREQPSSFLSTGMVRAWQTDNDHLLDLPAEALRPRLGSHVGQCAVASAGLNAWKRHEAYLTEMHQKCEVSVLRLSLENLASAQRIWHGLPLTWQCL